MLQAKNSDCIVGYERKDRPDGTYESIPVMGSYVIIEDDETHEKFVFKKDSVIKEIDCFNNTRDLERTIGTKDNRWVYNLKPNEFHARIKKIRDFVSNLTTDDMIKIVNCMPRNKNGTIRKATAPVIISGITAYNGDPSDGWCRISSVELCISYWYDNEFRFEFNANRDTQMKRQAIVDENGNYNQLVFKANSYLKPNELVPGRIYADAQDREFLYLGKTAIKYEDINEKGEVAFDHSCLQFPFTFIPINDKKRREIMEANTLKEWLQKTKRLSRKESFAMKVVSETGVGFKPEGLECSVDFYTKVDHYDEHKYTRHWRFRVYGVSMKYCYLVCENSTQVYSLSPTESYTEKIKTPVYTCETEADAAAVVKEFKRNNPGKKYSKQAQYCFGDAPVIVGPGQTMLELMDWNNLYINCKMDDLLVDHQS